MGLWGMEIDHKSAWLTHGTTQTWNWKQEEWACPTFFILALIKHSGWKHMGGKDLFCIMFSCHSTSLRKSEQQLNQDLGRMLFADTLHSYLASFLIQLRTTLSGNGAAHHGLGSPSPSMKTVPHSHAYRTPTSSSQSLNVCTLLRWL